MSYSLRTGWLPKPAKSLSEQRNKRYRQFAHHHRQLRQKIDIINKRQELLYAHNRKKKDEAFYPSPMEALLDILFSGTALVFCPQSFC